MLENLKNKIAGFIIDSKLKKKSVDTQSFNSVFKNAKTFFIILPEDETDFHHAIQVFNYFESNGKTFSIFTHDYRINLLPAKLRSFAYSFTLKQRTFLKLPSKDLVKILGEIKTDAVIDLNRKENLFFSYASNIVISKLRIGFKKNNSDKFYNLQFANGEESAEFFYKNFLNCLRMF